MPWSGMDSAALLAGEPDLVVCGEAAGVAEAMEAWKKVRPTWRSWTSP